MHKLALQPDFFECLRTIGRLPKMRISDVAELEKENQDLNSKVEDQEEKIKALEAELEKMKAGQ